MTGPRPGSSPGGNPQTAHADRASSELGTRLLFSAQAVEKNDVQLKQQSRHLRAAMGERVAASVRLQAQILRIVIALGWFLLGFALMVVGNQSTSTGVVIDGFGAGLTSDDAKGLGRFFLIAGFGAFLFSLIAAAYVVLFSRSNARIKRAGDQLGLYIAFGCPQF